MRVLVAAGRPFVPEEVTGAVRDLDTLLQLLSAEGHSCEVVAEAGSRLRLIARRVQTVMRAGPLAYFDRRNGYPHLRAFPGQVVRLAVERIVGFKPDIVLTALEDSIAIATEAVRTKTPVLISVLDNNYRWLNGTLPESSLVGLICNSCFIRERVRERFGKDPEVIYPCIRLADYRADPVEPAFITLVNPVYEKGVNTALQLAKLLPHRRFQFVRGWKIPWKYAWRNELRMRAAVNVTCRRRTLDMRPIYAQTSILIAPSVCEEAFGRVILEAHASGIPVIASRIGGIPEAVGSGGLLLAPDATAEDWAQAVESVLNDNALRARLSAHARSNAARPEFDSQRIAHRFLEVAAAHLVRCRV